MAKTVVELKKEFTKAFDKAIETTTNELNWPYTADETVSFYDLMKIFKNLRKNFVKCMNDDNTVP